MAVITVLGSSGYIGSRLALAAQRQGHEVVKPGRDQSLAGTPLGTVLYCIGLTGDYRSRPFDTVEAHVCHLSHLLQHCRFDRLVYLSSTRLYLDACGNANEDAVLAVRPAWADDLYNLSKALGESLALNSGRCATIERLRRRLDLHELPAYNSQGCDTRPGGVAAERSAILEGLHWC